MSYQIHRLSNEYYLRNSSLRNFLHFAVLSYLLGPNILLINLLSNLCFSLLHTNAISNWFNCKVRRADNDAPPSTCAAFCRLIQLTSFWSQSTQLSRVFQLQRCSLCSMTSTACSKETRHLPDAPAIRHNSLSVSI